MREFAGLVQALSMASVAESMAGDPGAARRFIDEAEAAAAGLDFVAGTISVLQARAVSGLYEADLDAFRSATTEGARLADEAGDLYSLAMMLLEPGVRHADGR